MGLRKINTRGIEKANEVMLMSAVAYNLKKYLKFVEKKVKIIAIAKGNIASHFNGLFEVVFLNQNEVVQQLPLLSTIIFS
jgi:hypothetical protein